LTDASPCDLPADPDPDTDPGNSSTRTAPFLVAGADDAPRTGLLVIPQPDGLPAVWAGPVAGPDGAAAAAAATAAGERCGLLPEHAARWYGRPGLSGHRLAGPGGAPAAGRDWSPLFGPARLRHDGATARIEADDPDAGLRLVTEIEAVPGGAIRCRHTLTNTGQEPYVVDGLEVVVPLPGHVGETLDFTGRQLAERIPQRRPIHDGLWLREGRRGRTGHDSATVLAAGVPGFTFGTGEVWGVHVAWSGNSVHRIERLPSGLTTIGGGELLLPGEVTIARGESYATPWVFLAASRDGLDDLAAQFHGYLRSLPAHPASPRPVTLNVWEAVYFRHDLAKLTALADLAAGLGVERYVLDDGWFRGRRHDGAGLGDWWVDEEVWPGGLHKLVDYVRGRGLAFGLWVEPEMVNPDSDLYRAHPDWILATGHRIPPLQRHQLVLDLTRPEVFGYLLERMTALLAEYDISYVKWDHNRDLLDAGSGARGGAPAVHDQTLALYALLDELRRRHPEVEWESCASGGGRVDLAILERTQRIWTSDMTDALARQAIQRWTGQLVPPEYLGAHVSAPFGHQTGRYMPLALRCATALFGHFGIEWDLTQARDTAPGELAELGTWIALYKAHRELIHSGRVYRADRPDDTAWIHGVVAADRTAALLSYVQLDEPRQVMPVALRVPGLDPARRYRVTNVTPAGRESRPVRRPPAAVADAEMSGAALAEIGLAIPAQRPLTALVILVTASG
jgi:alpha-galactosidase